MPEMSTAGFRKLNLDLTIKLILMTIAEAPVGPSYNAFTDQVMSDSKLPTYPQHGSPMYVFLSHIYRLTSSILICIFAVNRSLSNKPCNPK